MRSIGFVAFLGVLVVAGSCSMEASGGPRGDRGGYGGKSSHYSLHEVSSQVSRLTGQLVIVHGFLADFGPIMILIESANSNRYEKPSLLVSDSDLREKINAEKRFVDLSEYMASRGCLEKYVQITGRIGPISEQQHNGIVQIESIQAYEGETSNGVAQSCYMADGKS